jgi:hypothetical protein
MLNDQELRELLSFQSTQPVLSVYLNTDPAAGSAAGYKLRLRSMLKGIELPADVEAIETYIEHKFDWTGRSLALFSCAPVRFFRAYALAIPTRDRVRTLNSPYVKPLADLLDFYGGYGVALVDKQGARLFYFHLGELREHEGTLGEAVRHVKRGGASTFPGRRGGIAGRTDHQKETVERNMKEAADFAASFFHENNIRRVIIAGADENIHLFKNALPKTWQSLVVGHVPMPMTANIDEVLQKAMQIGQQAEQKHEVHLVETLVTHAAKGQGGVTHLDDTLQAVHDGRVQTLVVSQGFRAPGFQCRGCGYLTSSQAPACPYCANTFQEIPDAVELAVRQVMQHGGEVEILQLEKIPPGWGNIGAILRY